MPPKKSPTSILVYLLLGIIVVFRQSLIAEYTYGKLLEVLFPVAFGLVLISIGIWVIDRGYHQWLTRIFSSTSNHSI